LIWFLGLLALPELKSHLSGGRTPSKGFRDIWRTMKEPSHLSAFSLAIVMMVSGFTVIPYSAAFLVGNVHFPEASLPYLYMVGGCFTLAAARLIGKLSDRFGKALVFRGFALISMTAIFMVTHITDVSVAVAIAISAFFMISMSGRMIPAMTMITSSVTPERRGSFMSVNSSLQQLAAGAAATLGGWVITQAPGGEILHFGIVGWISIGFTGLGMLFSRKIKIVS
jgi:predicted MFS family arabinose efflux permease